MTVGGMSCLCPAEAAANAPAAAVDADHLHAHGIHGAGGPGDTDTAGCGHEGCGPDCSRVSATAAKAKATIPGKETPSADDPGMPPMAPALPASISAPIRQSASPPRQALLHTDSPVRRFDRLLD